MHENKLRLIHPALIVQQIGETSEKERKLQKELQIKDCYPLLQTISIYR